jgi:hypothetical protein
MYSWQRFFSHSVSSHKRNHFFCYAKLFNSQDAPLLMNGLRKCGIYIQWNSIQPQRRMKFCHLQVNGWNWRIT